MSLATRVLHRFLAVTLAAFVVAGCSPDAGGGGTTVDQPPIVTNTSGFDVDTTGTFVVGTSPQSATFSGGLTRGGKWIIRDGTSGTVAFTSPVRQVDFELESLPLAEAAKASRLGLTKTTCGVGSQGLDDGEAFGNQLFLRGEFNGWSADADFAFFNFGDNIYQAEFELAAGDYPYKIAQAEWDVFDRIVDGEPTLPTFTYVTVDPGPGGPNGTLSIPSDGCWNVTLDATDTANVTLVLTKIVLDTGGGGGKTTCGVGNQGLDDGEAFSGQLFMRGAFSGWAADSDYAFYNFGNNIYQAEFELAAGEYPYKIAQAEWDVFDRIVAGEDTLPDQLYVTSDPGPGGPNGTLVLPKDGCWNVQLDATDTANITLIVTEVDLSGGGGPGAFVGVEVRLFDSSGNELDSEEFDAADGPLDIAPSYTRAGSQPAIGRMEIESRGGAGDLYIDNFTWSVNPRDVPSGGTAVDVVYHRPDGDYSDTVIVYEGQSYACVAGSLGCVATISALPNSTIQFTVVRGGIGDATGVFTGSFSTAGQDLYVFSGNPEAVAGNVSVAPGPDEVLLFYQRADGVYDGWTVHLFPTGSPDWTNYNPGLCTVSGVDPLLGGYFLIKLPPQPCYDASPPALGTFPDELGFIIHKGDEKDPGPDQFLRIGEVGNVAFVVSGINAVTSAPPSGSTVSVNGRAAHWVTRDTILWRPAAGTRTVELAWSADGTIGPGVGELSGNYESVILSAGTNPEPANQRHLWQRPGWEVPADLVADAAELARYQLVMIGRDRFGVISDATNVQIPGLLDDLYAAASAVPLGVDWGTGSPTVRVWAPTADVATGVTLNLYSDPQGTVFDQVAMTLDPATGIWSASGGSGWNRLYYDFTLRVWSYAVNAFVVNTVTDPWSVSLSADSRYSQIVNLADADLKPEGWDALELPTPAAPEDIVLYELHMRDFSVHDPSVPDALRGKYGAFALTSTAGHDHLQALADAGLTHVHILPAFDIATIKERRSDRIELDDTVADLCVANPAAAGLCPANSGKSIGQLLEELTVAEPAGQQQQQIVDWLRNLDGFNWSYDPWHFGVPEGSYATDPDGVARIIEFREMVQGLAGKGLRTVMDVVYNHTNQGGQGDRSVLDRVVPGYYHRYNEATGAIETSTCCSNTATEFAMMEKLMADTLETFTSQYKVGGYRFDLMGHQPKAAMLRVRERLEAIDPGTFLYGEGWNFGEVAGDRRFVQATQVNMAGTGIATFTDRIRDAVRGGGPFDTGAAHVATQGFISGGGYDPNAANRPPTAAFVDEALLSADQIRAAMAGSVKTFSFEDRTGNTVTGADVPYGGDPVAYVDDPGEIINYSAAHDNETLWDISQHKHPKATGLASRVRAHNLGLDVVLLAQGVPFVHAGQDLLRSKSMDRNSYDSGDWFNKLDLTFQDNNWAVGLPPRQDNQASWPQDVDALTNANAKATPAEIAFARDHFREMLQVRKSTILYRLPNATEIASRVAYFNTGPTQAYGVIAQGIEGCSSSTFEPEYGYVMTLINANDEAQSLSFDGEFAGQDFQLHPVLASSVDPIVQSASFDSGSGTFSVPARTTAVFVRAEQFSCSPFGEDIFLRGSMFDWANPAPETARFSYDGGVGYELAIDLDAGTYNFKIASQTWESLLTDCGGETGGLSVTIDEPFTMSCTGSSDIAITVAAAGTHVFSLDATSADRPVLTVRRPSYSVPIFVRGLNADWGTTNRLEYVGGDRYLKVIDVPDPAPGNRRFKIASEDWATVNCGTPGDGTRPTTSLGEVYALACGDGTGDIELLTAEAGQYSFLVDAADPGNPTVTVTAPPYGQGTTVFVRGLNNDWGTTQPMTFVGDGAYQASIELLGLAGGDTNFKVATEDWATVNCGVPVGGTDTGVAPGESYVMGCGDGTGDITLETDVLGIYDFRLDAGEAPTTPTLTVTGP